ncbi:wax ester/triacylglycerol synthase domain-containing protein [Patulibacter minatonensis]|uniref:wax ester/triacylglycerol synthase domain-containing protein n=1 Tax=Patulibacter minatonensis TaxID=298163 RepID=UPI00047C8C7C|nr:wax ester/triacylglycerol synthase domain-containing protein [Patulibacter minatonensis]
MSRDAPADWGVADELTPFEAMMWRADANPALRSAGVVVEILDHAPEWERLRAGHQWAVRRVRRMRQRILDDPTLVGQPAWVDTEVDLDVHVRRVRLPEGSTLDDALRVAGDLHEEGFDRTRPQWLSVLVEGLPDGRAMYLLKLHHAMADGTAIVQLLDLLHSSTRDPTVTAGLVGPLDAAPRSSGAALAVRHATRQATRTPGLALRGGRAALGLAVRPRKGFTSARRYAQSLGRVLGAPAGTPSPAMRERSLGRALFPIDVPVKDLSAAGKRLGGSLNDAYLAGLGGGLRRYHAAIGVEVDEVPLGMPISLRTAEDESGGNRFAGARIALPVAEPDPAERVRRIREQVLAARGEPALDFTGATAPMMSRAPTALLTRATASFTNGLDVQASNFRGLDREAFMAGAEVLAVYPMGPVPGSAFMATLISHRGTCCIGVAVDTAAVTDVELLRRSLREGFDEVLGTTGATA